MQVSSSLQTEILPLMKQWESWGNKRRPCRSQTLLRHSNHSNHTLSQSLTRFRQDLPLSPVEPVDASVSHSTFVLLVCRP